MSYNGLSPKANRVRFQPRSSDPVNPSEGDMQYADGTARAEGVWYYSNGAWVQLTPATDVTAISTKTANYTLVLTDSIILADATSGSITLTLPTAASASGKRYSIKKIDSSTNSVTIDPNGSELIDGVASQVLGAQWDGLQIASNGSSWYVLGQTQSQNIEVYVDTGAGHGSTNTRIRRFTNVRKNTLGPFATYADSATLGASVTINVPGLYEVRYTDLFSGGAHVIGVSLNSAVLTTSIAAVTYAQGKRTYASGGGNLPAFCTATIRCSAGDVIRPHTDGQHNGADQNNAFVVIRVGA